MTLNGAMTVPGYRPRAICGDRRRPGGPTTCNRRAGHGGRHAWIWWGIGSAFGSHRGVVRAVWGERS